MADAAVAFLLGNISQLISQTFRKTFQAQKILDRQIDKIRESLEVLNSQLQEESGRDDVSRLEIIRQINESSCRFENLLEALNINNYSPGRCSVLQRIPVGIGKKWSTMKKFDEIINDIENSRCGWSRYHLETPIEPSGHEYMKRDQACRPKFVGREEEMERLLSYLFLDGQVITISGMPGIGKTALAQQFFHHPMVEKEYKNHRPVWISVWESGKFQRIEVLKEIIVELGLREDPSSSKEYALEDMVDKISFHLEKTKTLIVLDGISSVDDWEFLKVILPRVNTPTSSTKILITTSMKEVARSSGRTKSPRWIHLTKLTDDQGFQLLVNHAPEHLRDKIGKDLGNKIVNLCCGLPLSIVAFAESMKTKCTSLEEWEEEVTMLLSYVSGRRHGIWAIREMPQILASTYYHLPRILQQVFLYMGVLQEDLHIEVEKLCLLSVADGILKPIQTGGRQRLVDIEQSYVTEVAQRSIVDLEEGEEPAITRFKYCKISGIMRDVSFLRNEDEHFLKVVDFAPESNSSSFRTSRVAINLDDYEEGSGFPLKVDDMMHMRVVLLTAKGKRFQAREFPSLVKFKHMRVLDFNGFEFGRTKLPKGIKRAVHLRYLSFKDCILHELPSWVANLKFLCILDLRVEHSTTMIIPNVLWKMKKLKHIYFPILFRTADGRKLRLDGLIELETITNLDASVVNLDDLLVLPNLEYLDANVIENVEELQCIVKRITRNSDVGFLRTSLSMRNFDCFTEERDYVLRKLLACSSLIALSMKGSIRMPVNIDDISQNLTKIEFIGSHFIDDPMKTLELLPKLRVLVLNDAFVGNKIECSTSGFFELKILKILNLYYLEEWIVGDGAMPKLSTLVICNSSRLEMLPDGLRFVPGLRNLKVSQMPKDFGDRIRVGDDGYKVQHVPSITIEDMC